MRILKNCWDQIETFNCQYGAHLCDGHTVSIYVNHWLDVSNDLRPYFSRKNEDGFVGHCLLVFRGVERANFETVTYKNENGQTVWSEPISFNYIGTSNEPTNSFHLEGSLQGFPSSVTIKIEAEKFELHVLDKDEPAKEG
jgi:hypothetical protein